MHHLEGLATPRIRGKPATVDECIDEAAKILAGARYPLIYGLDSTELHAQRKSIELADLIGVTYQQAHKYERGINRVSAGRLYEIAQVLSVPVGYFFDGLEEQAARAVSPRERMCLELARNFAQIPNERHQEALSQLARVLAAE